MKMGEIERLPGFGGEGGKGVQGRRIAVIGRAGSENALDMLFSLSFR